MTVYEATKRLSVDKEEEPQEEAPLIPTYRSQKTGGYSKQYLARQGKIRKLCCPGSHMNKAFLKRGNGQLEQRYCMAE